MTAALLSPAVVNPLTDAQLFAHLGHLQSLAKIIKAAERQLSRRVRDVDDDHALGVFAEFDAFRFEEGFDVDDREVVGTAIGDISKFAVEAQHDRVRIGADGYGLLQLENEPLPNQVHFLRSTFSVFALYFALNSIFTPGDSWQFSFKFVVPTKATAIKFCSTMPKRRSQAVSKRDLSAETGRENQRCCECCWVKKNSIAAT